MLKSLGIVHLGGLESRTEHHSLPSAPRTFFESGCLGMQPKVGGKLLPKLNKQTRPIANKYREGKMKSTLKRKVTVRETVSGETHGISDARTGIHGRCPGGVWHFPVGCINEHRGSEVKSHVEKVHPPLRRLVVIARLTDRLQRDVRN